MQAEQCRSKPGWTILIFYLTVLRILQYQIDQQEPRQLTLERSQGWKKIVLHIPKGDHQIRFYIGQAVGNQFVKLRFQDDIFNMSVSRERAFFISSHKQPLRIYVKGPTLVRIDEWRGGKINSRTQNVTTGWQLLHIPPSAKQKQSLLQIKQRVAATVIKPINTRKVPSELHLVPPAIVDITAIPTADPMNMKDYFHIDRQHDGSWSVATDLVRRNNVEEDSELSDPEQFMQLRVNHRYFDEHRNAYWNTQGLFRLRQFGGPTLGFSESLFIQPDDFPFQLNLQAKLFTQIVENDFEWLGQFRIAISQLAHITPKTSIRPKLSWFARYLSAENNAILDDKSSRGSLYRQKIDQDIYTDYKADHNTGLAASLLFTHDPWLDTRWTAKINSVSNENMNIFIPDHFTSEVHWKQLLGAVNIDASYRVSFYQKDQDRSKNSMRQFTKLDFNWQPWMTVQKRFEISGEYLYDIDKNEHLGMLSFTYHFGESSGYQNFKPGAIDFRQIKQRQRLDGYQ